MQNSILTNFKDFREQLFLNFSSRADATMELTDALAGNADALSVVQLSENPAFRRQYGSIRDAIGNFQMDATQQKRIEQILIQQCSPITNNRPFRLLVLDCTPAPRKFAKTLADRGIVHAPNVVPGNKPITVGHQYSIVGFLPEKSVDNVSHPWLLPLSVHRVATDTNGINVGIEQINALVPAFGAELTAVVGDTAYSNPKFIAGTQQHANTVLIARLQSNRTINRKAAKKILKASKRRSRGHELWYGDAFNFKDPTTWHTADDEICVPFVTNKGKQFTANICSWHDMLMRQKKGLLLNEYPFTVVKITITDEGNNPVYTRPMWLMVSGKRRQELNLTQIWEAYKQRYDVEHFFKFGKTRLLMDKFQTPEVAHEESWWQLACLAYAQLYMVRELASNTPRHWEKYLPQMKNTATIKSARQVQKSFARITSAIGTPASAPKPRGNPLGRATGTKLERRARLSIIFKGGSARKAKVA